MGHEWTGAVPRGKPAFTRERARTILEKVSEGASIEVAAEAARVDKRSVYTWLERGREWDEAPKESANAQVVARREAQAEFARQYEIALQRKIDLHLQNIENCGLRHERLRVIEREVMGPDGTIHHLTDTHKETGTGDWRASLSIIHGLAANGHDTGGIGAPRARFGRDTPKQIDSGPQTGSRVIIVMRGPEGAPRKASDDDDQGQSGGDQGADPDGAGGHGEGREVSVQASQPIQGDQAGSSRNGREDGGAA